MNCVLYLWEPESIPPVPSLNNHRNKKDLRKDTIWLAGVDQRINYIEKEINLLNLSTQSHGRAVVQSLVENYWRCQKIIESNVHYWCLASWKTGFR
jgi:hypothetical protein